MDAGHAAGAPLRLAPRDGQLAAAPRPCSWPVTAGRRLSRRHAVACPDETTSSHSTRFCPVHHR